jgi:hypothetical protein
MLAKSVQLTRLGGSDTQSDALGIEVARSTTRDEMLPIKVRHAEAQDGPLEKLPYAT